MKEDVLGELLINSNKIISGTYLGNKFNVSRNAIWKVINNLKNDGYNIKTVQGKGYILEDNEDIINTNVIKRHFKNNPFKEIEYFETITSTNDYLKNKNIENYPVAVIANEQTKGRGRRGNKVFHSPKNNGIYFSFAFKSEIEIKMITYLTIVTAISVCNAIKEVSDLEVDIKWINDIYYKKQKIGGILTEAIFEAEVGKIEKIIIGIGLNVLSKNNLPKELESKVVALNEISNKNTNKNQLIANILSNFNDEYEKFLKNKDVKKLIQTYKKKLNIIGEKVKVTERGKEFIARVDDLLENGNLLVSLEDNSKRELSSAEISLIIN